MPAISAKMVMELRDSTNLPMMKCKAALEQANGDRDEAIKILRQQFKDAKDKFAGRETPNGTIGLAVKDGAGVLVLLGCQTDFVANSAEFIATVNEIAQAALAAGADSVDAVKNLAITGGTVEEIVTSLIAKIRENIVLVKVVRITGAAVVGYNHNGRIGALVAGTNNADNKLKSVALHVASANPAPVAFDRAGVDPALVAKEKEILETHPEVLAKPEAFRPKIIDGKLGRFYKENVLLEQELALDEGQGDTVEKFAKRVGITLSGFARLAV